MKAVREKRRTVLCIEEQMQVLDALTTSLADTGHDVVRTSSGEQALHYIQSQPVDGVLIDAALRCADARELRAQVWKAREDMPVMLIQCSGDQFRRQVEVLDAWIEHVRQ